VDPNKISEPVAPSYLGFTRTKTFVIKTAGSK